MNDSVATYLHEIGQVPLLDGRDEETELAELIAAGRDARARWDAGERGRELRKAIRAGDAAHERFVRANLRLVVSLARRYALPQSMDLLDLIQEGNLGLMHAVDKFDASKGFKFSTYATYWIRQAIGRAIDMQGSTIRVPGDKLVTHRREIRESQDVTDGRIHRILTPTSLDADRGDDSGRLIDTFAGDGDDPESAVELAEARARAVEAMEMLDDRQRVAVACRFGMIDGEQWGYRQIGAELGVTGEAARRYVQRALKTMQESHE